DGRKLLVALVGMGIGISLSYRFAVRANSLILAAFLFGGFFGGLALAAIGIAPRLSMVYLAPYFIGCGLLCAAATAFVQRRRRSQTAA
ncbi:MAG: hypothetical protein K8I30_23395, partial [Anaerolineae bacterium]|nr:hypothetical protein [Anaerolineae bacterium]